MGIRDLTMKEVAFARAYHANEGNGTRACREAYDYDADADQRKVGSHASQLLKKPEIQQFLADLKEIESANAQIDRNFLIREFMEIGRLAREKKDYRSSLSALELAGKALPGGIFTDRVANEKEPPAGEAEIRERMAAVAKELERLGGKDASIDNVVELFDDDAA